MNQNASQRTASRPNTPLPTASSASPSSPTTVFLGQRAPLSDHEAVVHTISTIFAKHYAEMAKDDCKMANYAARTKDERKMANNTHDNGKVSTQDNINQ